MFVLWQIGNLAIDRVNFDIKILSFVRDLYDYITALKPFLTTLLYSKKNQRTIFPKDAKIHKKNHSPDHLQQRTKVHRQKQRLEKLEEQTCWWAFPTHYHRNCIAPQFSRLPDDLNCLQRRKYIVPEPRLQFDIGLYSCWLTMTTLLSQDYSLSNLADV